MHARTRKLALLEGVTAGVFFGTAAIFIRLLPSVDAFTIAFWRLIVACIALTATLIFLKTRLSLGLIRKNSLQLIILGLLLALHLVLFISSVKDTTILNATVLVNTAPIFSMFISAFIFKQNPSKLALMGLAISFAGAFVIAFAETSNSAPDLTSSVKGDAEAMLAAIVEAFYLNYGRKVRAQMNILSIMLPIYFFAGIAVGILSIPVSNELLTLPTTLKIILPLVGLGLLATAVAHTLYFSSLSNLKSFETANLALIEPVGATILGVAIFREIPGTLFVLGASLVLIGVLFVAKTKVDCPKETSGKFTLRPQLSSFL